MGLVYHGSKEHNIKRIEPRKSTHGNYVYATPEKVLAIHFSGRSGDDLTYGLGHYSGDKEAPWDLVEFIPGAFERMYDNSASIYSFSDETFKDIHSGFCEVVSDVCVDVLEEEYIENVYDAIMDLGKQGLLNIYRYPDKPPVFNENGFNLLDKYKMYVEKLGMKLTKNQFDRLAYLHPYLLPKINAFLKEFNFEFSYEVNDLVSLFADRVKRQISNPDNEQYIDSAYISIVSAYPELNDEILNIYDRYKTSIDSNKIINSSVVGV